MIKNILRVLFIVPFIFGCKVTPNNIVDSYIYEQNKGRINSKWEVVWEDHFENPQLDTTKWTRIPPNNADWGRHMTDDPRCYNLADGKLFLRGIVNPDTLNDPRPFLTGGVYTKNKFAFQYGKIEIPKIGEEEPVFILRAQDRLAQGIVEIYRVLASSHGSPLAGQLEEEIERFCSWSGPKKMPD